MSDLHSTRQKQRSFYTMDAASRRLLVVFSPDAGAIGRTWSIGARSEHELGRGTGHPDRIADPLMSSRHLRVSWQKGGSLIEDLGSNNGTYVDGKRITGAVMLDTTSVISAGDTLLVVDQEPEHGSLPVAPDAIPAEVPGLIGSSLAAQMLRRSLATVAPLEGAVLLLGPSGTGKEVSAQSIHELSKRQGAFVAVNCAAIPAEIAEAELFGHAKGAFTGADTARDGYFVRAQGGTLFLDEIGDLSLPLQAKLLRVLEDHRVQPVGAGGRSIPVDVRVVAATNVDLWSSGFRSDLLARLADWVLRLPPLIERRADVLELWRHFEQKASAKLRPMTAEFAEALLLHDWPRNVRELRKLANGVSTLTRPDAGLDLPALPPPMQRPIRARFERRAPEVPAARSASSSPPEPEVDSDSQPETDENPAPSKATLVRLLQEARGNVKQVAADNGWHRNQVYRWLKRAGIDANDYR